MLGISTSAETPNILGKSATCVTSVITSIPQIMGGGNPNRCLRKEIKVEEQVKACSLYIGKTKS